MGNLAGRAQALPERERVLIAAVPVPLPRQYKHKRNSHTSKHANMPASSSVLRTPSRNCKVNVPHWKTPRLPATDPGSLPLTLKWKRHKKIWTRSMHAGRNFRRKLTVFPLADYVATPHELGLYRLRLTPGPVRVLLFRSPLVQVAELGAWLNVPRVCGDGRVEHAKESPGHNAGHLQAIKAL